MNQKTIINTKLAPQAIGTYSQAVRCHDIVYLSGQIPLVPDTMDLVSNNIDDQIHQVFTNMRAVAQAAGGDLSNFVKITIFLTDMQTFSRVNSIMTSYFTEPYPARSVVEVAKLPRYAQIEVEGVMFINTP